MGPGENMALTEPVNHEWCSIHERREESCSGDYRRCIECGHIYRTQEDLLKEFRKQVAGMDNLGKQMRSRAMTIPVGFIYSCPLCGHDF